MVVIVETEYLTEIVEAGVLNYQIPVGIIYMVVQVC
jgi:hypothetical protein